MAVLWSHTSWPRQLLWISGEKQWPRVCHVFGGLSDLLSLLKIARQVSPRRLHDTDVHFKTLPFRLRSGKLFLSWKGGGEERCPSFNCFEWVHVECWPWNAPMFSTQAPLKHICVLCSVHSQLWSITNIDGIYALSWKYGPLFMQILTK